MEAMEGFVKNISTEWAYAMKRSVRPGGEIPLNELFEQYGTKYDMEPGDEFIEWLQNIKLKNTDRWRIVYEFKDSKKDKMPEKSVEKIEKKLETKSISQMTTPMVAKKMQIEDVVNLTVRKAREVLPKVNDLQLLKYSLNEARQLADKDSLCRLLHKRIRELQISR